MCDLFLLPDDVVAMTTTFLQQGQQEWRVPLGMCLRERRLTFIIGDFQFK